MVRHQTTEATIQIMVYEKLNKTASIRERIAFLQEILDWSTLGENINDGEVPQIGEPKIDLKNNGS